MEVMRHNGVENNRGNNPQIGAGIRREWNEDSSDKYSAKECPAVARTAFHGFLWSFARYFSCWV